MGILQKQTNRLRRTVHRLLQTRIGAAAIRSLGLLAGSFLLAGGRAAGRPLPLAACLVLVAGLWPGTLTALAGACGGYVLLWGWEAAMEPLALSLSFFAAAVIFRSTQGPAWGL